MATAAAVGNGRSVSIGNVLTRAFGTIGSNPVATLGIAFLFSALPSLLVLYAAQEELLDGRFADPTGLDSIALAVLGFFSTLVTILLWMISQGALVRATVAFSEGGKASPAESALAGLRVAVPLFLLMLVGVIAVMLGFVLLIVPGVILYVMWSVAAPALVEERLGPIEALGRSRYLTSGVRWKVFGLTLVLFVGYLLITGIAEIFGVASNGDLDELAASGPAGLSPAYLAISAISSTITSAVWGVTQASLYIELRDWKDGPPTKALAEIFG